MRRLLWLSLGALLLASGAVASSGGANQAEARWVITDLGTLGGKKSKAVAIDDQGQRIVGTSQTGDSPNQHAFLWQGGRLIDLGTLGGTGSFPFAINPGGQVIGISRTKSGERRGFVWAKGVMRDLGTLGGRESYASAINSRGQIVGWSLTKDGRKHACLWERGTIRDLGTLDGANSAAVGINDRGQIVGWSERQRTLRVVLWENHRIKDLGPLGYLEAAYPSGWNVTSGELAGINERGQVLWYAQTPSGLGDGGILWQKGQTTKIPLDSGLAMNDRGWVIGDYPHWGLWRSGQLTRLDFWPRGINNHGLVVGARGFTGHDVRAIAWQNGKRTFLPALGAGQRISEAIAVNDRGQIVGVSEYHAVLWTLKR